MVERRLLEQTGSICADASISRRENEWARRSANVLALLRGRERRAERKRTACCNKGEKRKNKVSLGGVHNRIIFFY
jgi:hypothetical protein